MRVIVIATVCLAIVNIILCSLNKEITAVLGWIVAVIYMNLYLLEITNNKEVVVRDPKTGIFKKK